MRSESVPPAPAGKSRTWIIFFLMLAFLAGLGILVPLFYNLSLQLKAEDVAAAKALWQEKGLADYDLEYMTKIDKDEPVEYRVAVRSSRVQWVASHDEVVLSHELYEAAGSALGCPVRLCANRVAGAEEMTRLHSIDAFFALIESKLGEDVAVGGRNYATATFDLKYGHPLRYIHRVRGSSERIELNVRLFAPDEAVETR